MRKIYEIDPSRPLPPNLDTEYWETFAKLILEEFYPKEFYDLSVDNEKPDLRNASIGVGVEVTSSEKTKNLEKLIVYMLNNIHTAKTDKEERR